MTKFVFALFLLCSVVFAPTTRTATVVGTITDNTRAMVPGATIGIVNTETQFISQGISSAEGYYYVPNSYPGTYPDIGTAQPNHLLVFRMES